MNVKTFALNVKILVSNGFKLTLILKSNVIVAVGLVNLMSKRKNLERRAKLKLRKAVAKLTPEQVELLQQKVREILGLRKVTDGHCKKCESFEGADLLSDDGLCAGCFDDQEKAN